MSALIKRHVLPSAIRRVVRGVSVVRGHCVPKGTPCRPKTAANVSQSIVAMIRSRWFMRWHGLRLEGVELTPEPWQRLRWTVWCFKRLSQRDRLM